ncbi:hypothetical protein OROGR_028835 [Orobanche gracilis]
MFHTHGPLKNTCHLLAVLSSRTEENTPNQNVLDEKKRFPFPKIVSSRRLEVQTLRNSCTDEFRKVLDSWLPNLVYLQGKHLPNDEIGSFVWEGLELSSTESLSGLFSSTMPTTVYLEVPNGERIAKSLHSEGIPYVIYWKNSFSCYAASQFRHALFSAIQSSSCHTWDAFQLAQASYRLHCLRNNIDERQKNNDEFGPNILGESPTITVDVPKMEDNVDVEESSPGSLPAVQIYDDDVNMRFLVCGAASSLDSCVLSSLEDGLSALLSIEMRGSKLHNRVSALPPPLQAATFSRGVVTMRSDLSTSSSAHISLLVSGNAQTCFDDQLLENHIKSEIIDKTRLVHVPLNSEEYKPPVSEPRQSISVACGAAVFEVCMKVPTWASHVLRQLALDLSYRTLVALGIASIQGLAVASFEKEDSDRLLFFCTEQVKDIGSNYLKISSPPSWLKAPPPSRKRPSISLEMGHAIAKRENNDNKETRLNGLGAPLVTAREKVKIAALRPIPHIRHQKMLPFSRLLDMDLHDGNQAKANLPIAPAKHSNNVGANPSTNRKSASSSYQAKQVISLNPPLKKHGCGRSPLHVCSEEEFLKDVMQFLILRGHNRLIPQGGLSEFPDAILNAKRLDLFNLYREVVTRGGFHVGNGINWKGQVFSKMRNHTVTNRMTGVGNTLKRHYETYLLEYELAHDDVDGECCLLCRRDYAKTDGLEYVCPQCSVSGYKKKINKSGNEYS